MAGIGFKLRRLTQDDTLAGTIQGYVGAGFICCGPWIMTVLALCTTVLAARWSGRQLDNFRVILVYTYAFSLIFTGASQNVVTRYLADRLYAEDADKHLPTFVATICVHCPLAALLAALFWGPLPLSFLLKVEAGSLFVVVGAIWLLMIFLGAVRAYEAVVRSFAWGTLIAATAGVALGQRMGEEGYLGGFLAGQATVFFLMLRVLLSEFELKSRWDFTYLSYFARYPALALSGVGLYLGVWGGTFFYWFTAPLARTAGLPTTPAYDVSMFFGLLTVIPAMTIFFVSIETEFYDGYRAFFGGITSGRARYAELERRKAEMQETLLRGLSQVFKVQGLISATAIFFAPTVLELLGLPESDLGLLRTLTLACFLLVLVQFVIMILYYYEAYRGTLATAAALLLGNLACNAAMLRQGGGVQGWGLVVGSTLAVTVGLFHLAWVLRNLEFLTFTGQPMPGQLEIGKVAAEEAFGLYIRKDGRWLIEHPDL